MKLRLQLLIESDSGEMVTTEEVAQVERLRCDRRRSASRSRGSSGLGSELRIPSSEDFIQLFIQDFRSCL